MLQVDIVYAAVSGVIVRSCQLAPGSTVNDALVASGFHETHPESMLCAVGIFAKRVPLETVLQSGDRVELYRPLVRDPKVRRRERSKKSR